MQVKILQMTQNPVDIMWTAARTCYSEKSPIDLWKYDRYDETQDEIDKGLCMTEEYTEERQNKMWKLVKQVLDSGHEGIAEMVYFTFAVEGVSRALLAQLSRHRLVSLCVQSQRYVEIKENKQELMEILNRYEAPEMKALCDKYFVEFKGMIPSNLIKTLCDYRDLVDEGCKPEDARMVLPNATKTNLVMSCNLRELIHICNLRMCSRSQTEIRQLFTEIKKQVTEKNEYIGNLLVPNCEKLGYCPEQHKSCGKFSNIKKNKGNKMRYYKEGKSNEINENLVKFLNMESAFEENQGSWHPTENGRNLFTSLTEDE